MKSRSLFVLLEPPSFQRARDGRFIFVEQIRKPLIDAGGHVKIINLAASARREYLKARANFLYYRAEPEMSEGLTFRHTPVGSFMRIERTTTRNAWTIARRSFIPEVVNSKLATRFAETWRNRLDTSITSPDRNGYILVPLQGKLLVQRSFQACAPIDMLRLLAETCRQQDIVATLHPSEKYDSTEIEELENLTRRYPRVKIEPKKSSLSLLKGSALVVTQNSSFGFTSLLFHRPLVIFADSELHHVAGSIQKITQGGNDSLEESNSPRSIDVSTVADALAKAYSTSNDDFDLYTYWFTITDTVPINRVDTATKFWGRCRRLGWNDAGYVSE